MNSHVIFFLGHLIAFSFLTEPPLRFITELLVLWLILYLSARSTGTNHEIIRRKKNNLRHIDMLYLNTPQIWKPEDPETIDYRAI